MSKYMNIGAVNRITQFVSMLNEKSIEKEGDKASRRIYILPLSFMVFLCLWQIWHRMFPSIEIIMILTILALIWRTQQRALLRDLLPFFILLITFQSLRGFVYNLNLTSIHVTDLIAYEKTLFSGVIPAYFLQSKLTLMPIGNLIGLLSSFFYMSHFVLPVVLAIILWSKDKSSYWGFIVGLLLLSYAAFITYVFYPAAPPWWATEKGYLVDQPVVLSPYAMGSMFQFAGPNPVAAMPSLHMAYPTFLALYSIYVWGKKAIWVALLPICVGFSAVYLGHHYVVDLLAGVVYGTIFFSIILIWKKIGAARSHRQIREEIENTHM